MIVLLMDDFINFLRHARQIRTCNMQ